MKIIITGSSGFLGTTLCAYLESQGLQPIKLNSTNCNLRNQGSLDIYSTEEYDFIIHLAAWTQAGSFCMEHPGDQWIINQQINTNVLEWWSRAQRQAKLVFMGTSCVYDPQGNLAEEEYMIGEPIESLYTYAMTKRMLYQGARALSKQYGLKYLCAVPSTLYGAGYHTDGRQMHFIFDLIKKIIRGKEYGEPVVLWGDGYQKRELVLVDDFAKILWEISQQFENQIFNIGAGHEYSIKAFAEKICNIVGYDNRKIFYDTSQYVGAKSKCLSIEKIKKSLQEYNLEPLDSGLSKTIEWFYCVKAFE